MAQSPHNIPANEQRWLTESFVDPNGRVFEWHGEIYRTMEPDFAARWKDLTDQGVIATLIRDGLLIESELTNLTTESGKTVLRHRRVRSCPTVMNGCRACSKTQHSCLSTFVFAWQRRD